MLQLSDLNKGNEQTTEEIEKNLGSLFEKLQKVEAAYGKPFFCTSGYRSMQHHQAIYAAKNAVRAKQGLPPLTVPLSSKHLYGHAADIADVSGDLWRWVMINMDLMVEIGFYFEDKSATPTWVHFQDLPPGSGKHIFLP